MRPVSQIRRMRREERASFQGHLFHKNLQKLYKVEYTCYPHNFLVNKVDLLEFSAKHNRVKVLFLGGRFKLGNFPNLGRDEVTFCVNLFLASHKSCFFQGFLEINYPC